MVARIKQAIDLAVYFLSGCVPRDKNRVVFGAWHGHRYSDNPRYLYEYLMEERPDLELIWVGKSSIRNQVPTGVHARFAERGTPTAAWSAMRSKWIFVSHGQVDVSPLSLSRRAERVYLGHGLAIKKMGDLASSPKAGSRWSRLARQLRKPANSYSYFIASSPAHREKLLVEYASQGSRQDNTLILGQPRCDYFLASERDDIAAAIRDRYAKDFGIPRDAKLIAYLPTFRDNNPPFSFGRLSPDSELRLSSILEGHHAVVAERSHFVDGIVRGVGKSVRGNRFFDLSGEDRVDTNELLLASDLLVTDYSGAYVDYLLLDRPVLHFTYDYANYVMNDRGLYFDLERVAGGPLFNDLDDLLTALDAHLENPSLGTEQRRAVIKILLSNERGQSSRVVAEALLPLPDHNAD